MSMDIGSREIGRTILVGPASWDRDLDLVLSRDGRQSIRIEELEDVALPLYEGRMIGQFDFSEKGWVSGKGRGAIWRAIGNEKKQIEPQYLIGSSTAREEGYIPKRRLVFMDICSATNARTFYGVVAPVFPCGNSVPVLNTNRDPHVLSAVLNSFAIDHVLRQRVGGLHLNWTYLDECPVIPWAAWESHDAIKNLSIRLNDISEVFAESWCRDENVSWRKLWAITVQERLRIRCMMDALVADKFGLSWDNIVNLMEGCDFNRERLQSSYPELNAKGFWRIDKEKAPELRQTVLTMVAFHDLKRMGLPAFLTQNQTEGWLIPETLCLADYGLGHDERAKVPQPVASRLGPRFLDWQLNEDVERSWQECAAHAALIRRIVPLPDSTELDAEGDEPAAISQETTVTYKQEGLF